jgi:hypothetical protein
MEQAKKQKPSATTIQRLDALVTALASNPNVYPKLTEPSLVATARKILAEIDKLG